MTREEARQLIADCPNDIGHYGLLVALHGELEKLEDIRMGMESKVGNLRTRIKEIERQIGTAEA